MGIGGRDKIMRFCDGVGARGCIANERETERMWQAWAALSSVHGAA